MFSVSVRQDYSVISVEPILHDPCLLEWPIPSGHVNETGLLWDGESNYLTHQSVMGRTGFKNFLLANKWVRLDSLIKWSTHDRLSHIKQNGLF